MTEIVVKDNKIKLKKDYLTNSEVNYIVEEVLEMYLDNSNEEIKGYDYSPLTMMTNFYDFLFGFCIDGYDMENIDDFNKYYNIGAQYELLRIVTNADEAYHLMMSLSKELTSVENVINNNLNLLVTKIIEKIPDMKELSKLVDKLPKEWQNAIDNYSKITGININKSKDKEDE